MAETLFERLQPEQLPFYLEFMRHLAAHGIPVPDPVPDGRGNVLHSLCGRPAAVVTRLRGRSVLAPQPAHCEQVGHWLHFRRGQEQPSRGLRRCP